MLRQLPLAAALFAAAAFCPVAHGERALLNSPDGRLAIALTDGAEGLKWCLSRDGLPVVTNSALGLKFVGPARGTFRIVDRAARSSDTTWTSTLYRRGTMRDRFNELRVDVTDDAAKPLKISIVLRAYDEGVAFRYAVPEQSGRPCFQILAEETEWNFADDPETWTTAYAEEFTAQEEMFHKRRISALDGKKFLGLPVLVRVRAGTTVALCEAALSNWAGLFYRATPTGFRASLAELPPSEASTRHVAVIRATPAESPWRVVIVGNDELDLLRKNDLIVNLNPPPDPSIDFSWVKAGPTAWDWWVNSNRELSNENEMKMIDLAAEMGWPYHTVDGGWYGWGMGPNHGPNVPLQPRPGFDLARVVRYAAEKGVGVWVWIHWMEIDDIGIEETFARLEKWGVKGVKTDFINRQDQWIVNWYEKVLRCAAKHRICVNFHGGFHPSGTERTWPNNLTREGILGNEMNKFHGPKSSLGIPAEHCLTLPFTRFLIGPGDFTPGGFGNVAAKDFIPQQTLQRRLTDVAAQNRVWAQQMGTRAFAIAQCVAYDSPLMTLCDWPERYRGAAGAEALKRLPSAWKSTLPLAGACGEHYSVAREAFDGRWYFAALTVKRRNVDLKLDFLPPGEWVAHVYADDPELTPGDPQAVAIGTRAVKAGDALGFTLCDNGGAVVVFERK